MRQGWRAEEAALIALGLVWVALAAFWAPAAFYSIDGFVYHAQIDAAAKKGGVQLAVGHVERFQPGIRRLRSLNPAAWPRRRVGRRSVRRTAG